MVSGLTREEIDDLRHLIMVERPGIVPHHQDCVMIRSRTWRTICQYVRKIKEADDRKNNGADAKRNRRKKVDARTKG